MNIGDLVEMYGEPGFYGIVLCPSNQSVDGWYVLWQSGFIFERAETLLEVINEER